MVSGGTEKAKESKRWLWGNRKLNGGIARYPEETRIFSGNPISYFYGNLYVIDPVFSIDCGYFLPVMRFLV